MVAVDEYLYVCTLDGFVLKLNWEADVKESTSLALISFQSPPHPASVPGGGSTTSTPNTAAQPTSPKGRMLLLLLWLLLLMMMLLLLLLLIVFYS